MHKPYIVSEDIHVLLANWASQKNLSLPKECFFRHLRSEFTDFMRQIFKNFELVPALELIEGLNNLVHQSGLISVSLDKSYHISIHNLEIARFVDIDNNDIGLRKRPCTDSIIIQFKKLQQELRNKEIVLVDDVIFSGNLLERVGDICTKMGIKVSAIHGGIGIEDGIKKLRSAGHSIQCVRTYEAVIDEICERDFYPGIPLSGRSVLIQRNINGDNFGAPYILPFGNPGKWASIPIKWQKPLSKFCIEQTIKLFKAIEKSSNKIIQYSDIDRKIIGLPTNQERYIDCLTALLLKYK